MTRLGFTPNPTIAEQTAVRFSVPISNEQLNLLDADLVVIFPITTSAEQVEQDPIFREVPAVRDGRYLVFDDPEASKSYSTNSALSLGYALDTVVPILAEKLST
ncbi:hypothetical protein [Rhodococcoides trifolii]|nr:hypothetical protein [Rhodococcus trifolii]